MPTFAEDALDDLGLFFDDFSDSDVITHGGIPTTIAGTYDNEYADIDLDSGSVQSSQPSFYCKTSLVPNATQADTHVITSVLHNITAQAFTTMKVQVSPSDLGPGMTRFILHKA
jgi:hypothetical protein